MTTVLDFDTYFSRALRYWSQSGSYKDAYRTLSWVYAIVTKRGKAIKSLPFQVMGNDGVTPVENEADPWVALFNRPNPFQSTVKQLWTAHSAWMDLRGECVWYLEPNDLVSDSLNPRPLRPGEVPAEVYAFNPDFFTPRTRMNGDPTILYWEMRVEESGEIVRVPPENIIQFKTFNPSDLKRGFSPLKPLQESIEADVKATAWNRSFFNNSAVPGGILYTDDDLSPEEAEKQRKNWEDRHKGKNKNARIAILAGGMKYQTIQASHADIAYLEQRKFTVEEICAVYGFPKSKLGFHEGMTFSNMDAADLMFWQESIVPDVEEWTEYIEKRLGVIVRFDLSSIEALIYAFAKKMQAARDLIMLGYTLNQVNDRLNLGMPDVPWGELPLSLFGYGGITTGGGQGQIEDEPIDVEIVEDEEDTTTGRNQNNERRYRSWLARTAKGQAFQKYLLPAVQGMVSRSTLAIRTSKGDAVHRSVEGRAQGEDYLKVLDPNETSYRASYRQYVEELFREQFRRLDDAKSVKVIDPDSVLFDEQRWAEQLVDQTAPVRVRTVEESLQLIARQLGTPILDLTDPRVVDILTRKEIKLRGVTRTLREYVRQVIVLGVREGASLQEIKSSLRTLKGIEKNSRALTIARTETAQAASGARWAAVQGEGVSTKGWQTANDEVTRPDHTSFQLSGEHPMAFDYATIATQPNSGRLLYPSDMNGGAGQIINCRCALLALD